MKVTGLNDIHGEATPFSLSQHGWQHEHEVKKTSEREQRGP